MEEEAKDEENVPETDNKKEKKSAKSNDGDDEIEVIEDEEEYDLLEEVFQLKKRKSEREGDTAAAETQLKKTQADLQKSVKDSFELIDTSRVKDNVEPESDVAAPGKNVVAESEIKDDFEHLSQYDPDDEFLRSNKSVSIIDSILSKKSISQTSDFSIISNAKSKKLQSMISMGSSSKISNSVNTIALVESNRDIYAEDVITQKIIYYVSLFSEDVSQHLQQIRSKKILFSNTSSLKDDLTKQEDLFILDLDDVDSNFVNLILDVLEYYELFRLCLMLCNRYHMSERLGRYLVSVCSKYSNLHAHRFNLKILAKQQLTLHESWA